jgi:hypothetical protein
MVSSPWKTTDHHTQTLRSINRSFVSIYRTVALFSQANAKVQYRFYCRGSYFMTEKVGDFHAIPIGRPLAPIREFGNTRIGASPE